MKTQPMADACPNYLDSPSCMLLSYLPRFGLLAQFGHPSTGDRTNCKSSESLGMRAVAPKSERQNVILDQKRSSSELYASIARMHCRSQHTSQLYT
jgi:hypothetical protein